jgi:hypothetical protein
MAAGKVSALTTHRALDHNRLREVFVLRQNGQLFLTLLYFLYTGVTIKATTSPCQAPMTSSTTPRLAPPSYKGGHAQNMHHTRLYLTTKPGIKLRPSKTGELNNNKKQLRHLTGVSRFILTNSPKFHQNYVGSIKVNT